MIPASVILVQAINHATEHRAHATTILTQLGIEPPAIDGWEHGGLSGLADGRGAPARHRPVRRRRRARPHWANRSIPRTFARSCSRYFAIATDAVERHGGRSRSSSATRSWPSSASRSRTTTTRPEPWRRRLELRDRVRADPALGDRVPIRLGVNGGEVIASREADASVLVTGDAVNMAARLQQAAEPWSILVRRADRPRRRRALPVRARSSRSRRRARPLPIPARELLGVASSRPRRRATRIVGREADLDQLELVARRAFDERRPYLVSIVAPAGVGKSRLLEEFLDHLDAGVKVAHRAVPALRPAPHLLADARDPALDRRAR